ncbi:Putative polypeptide N-acetylgalactosaminyltransferase-like protein 4 [Pteropus alecto]|uniref:Putative polypeptide N-acetylgalactosaminyltransferase-like protein 4 n=1 Tax=Pteropus alecto TaxID=9402 RepID=L5L2S7_PTEAL|nr:Putative polypeptide N-acetylgalactosaminyltransferase-like protein 4 [Pteropus alecto]
MESILTSMPEITLEAPAKPEEAEAEPFTDSSLFAHWGQELSPEGRRVALKQFQYYGYNAYLSDRLPLDRPLPDLRPSGCRNLSFPDSLPEVSIVFIFVNEALSVLLRSIHSAIERTPPHLLKEIILVDDNSSNVVMMMAEVLVLVVAEVVVVLMVGLVADL